MPFSIAVDCIGAMQAVPRRELSWMNTYAKPRFPYEPMHRRAYNHRLVSPDDHIQSLKDYLCVSEYLPPKDKRQLYVIQIYCRAISLFRIRSPSLASLIGNMRPSYLCCFTREYRNLSKTMAIQCLSKATDPNFPTIMINSMPRPKKRLNRDMLDSSRTLVIPMQRRRSIPPIMKPACHTS